VAWNATRYSRTDLFISYHEFFAYFPLLFLFVWDTAAIGQGMLGALRAT
jgi:hypothetical protein